MATFHNVVNGQPHSNWWDNGNNQVAFGHGNRGKYNDDWKMATFHNVVNGQPQSNWWDNGKNQVAFGHGNRGNNNDDWQLDMTLNTGMPGVTYRDVISVQKNGACCMGKTINVGGDGRAHFKISNTDEDPMVAIHDDSKL